MKIEAGKKYRTRDGGEVEVLRTDVNSDQPVVGIVTDKDDGSQWVATYSPNGSYFFDEDSPADILFEIKPKRVMWVNVYNDEFQSVGVAYSSRKEADGADNTDLIACIRVEFEEGQFDDDE